MLITNAREPYGCRKEGWPCYLDDDTVRCGHWVIEWIESFCIFTQGHWVKKPAVLQDWQKDYFIELFGVDPATNKRKYRWTLLGVPKKNGKSEMCGWLGPYMLMGDEEPSPWVAVAASSDQQADLVFGAAYRTCDWSPALSMVTEPFASEILVPSVPGAKMMRLSAKAGTNDGPSWHAVICDELHEWQGEQGRALWTVLTNGIGARMQPLVIQITTAGSDVEGTLCGEQYRFGLELADDPNLDPHYLFWWYQPEENANYKDVNTWRDANPSWGVTLPDPEAYLEDQLRKKRESEFKRYFLNMWTLSEDTWIADGEWDACEGDVEFDPTLPLYIGVDGAIKRDSFAIVGLQIVNGRVYSKARIWENPYPPGHALRDTWKLNMKAPMNFIRDLCDEFPEPAIYDETEGIIPGPAVAYDPAFIEHAMQELEAERINVIEVPQTPKRMSPASEKLYELIVNRDFVHEDDPVYSRHAHAAIPIETDRGWRIGKKRGSARKIDAIIATALAVSVAYGPDAESMQDNEIRDVPLW